MQVLQEVLSKKFKAGTTKYLDCLSGKRKNRENRTPVQVRFVGEVIKMLNIYQIKINWIEKIFPPTIFQIP